LLTWRTCYPFAILGAPFSLLGGATNLPSAIYQPIVGSLLLIAALQMVLSAKGASGEDQRAPAAPPFVGSLVVGGAIGYISGITGVGGGIFLAPLVLAFGWIGTRQSGAMSAAFNPGGCVGNRSHATGSPADLAGRGRLRRPVGIVAGGMAHAGDDNAAGTCSPLAGRGAAHDHFIAAKPQVLPRILISKIPEIPFDIPDG
jgi:hypothetical protein